MATKVSYGRHFDDAPSRAPSNQRTAKPGRPAAGLLLLAVCFTWVHAAQAETLADIEGLSIDVRWTDDVTILTPTGKVHAGHQNSFRAYISVKGNIFTFKEPNTSSRGVHYESEETASPIGNAIPSQRYANKLTVWTMLDGHLTKIAQLIAGFRIWTIPIDVAKLTCSFAARDEPEEKTGRHVSAKPDGTLLTIDQYTVVSSTCTVRKGNVFSADQ